MPPACAAYYPQIFEEANTAQARRIMLRIKKRKTIKI